MLQAGALDEAAALMERRLDPALPVMRAHGVQHLIGHLEGKLSLGEAAERARLDTRHYAKRQFTWARHQLKGFDWVARRRRSRRERSCGRSPTMTVRAGLALRLAQAAPPPD